MRKRYWMAWVACLVFPGVMFGQQRPLVTDDAEILPTGRVRAQVGVEFLQRQRYNLSGLEGDLPPGCGGGPRGGGEYAEFQLSE